MKYNLRIVVLLWNLAGIVHGDDDLRGAQLNVRGALGLRYEV